jgi:MFS family permease
LRQYAHAPALALGLAAFLTQFDITAVVVAMPLIGQELRLDIGGFAWVMDAYSLAFTAALLTAGALADRIGRRRAMLAGNALFLAASLACALASNGPTLWAARAVQGVGAAFAVTGAIALLASVYATPIDRARAFGLMGMVSGVAMALGPTLGGLIAEWFGWRWIFLANLPPCLALALAVPWIVPEVRVADGRPIDVVGVLLLTSALATVIASLLLSHDAPIRAVLGIVAGVVVTGLFFRQQRQHAHPLFELALFAKPAMIAIASLLLAVSIGYWAVLVYLPLFLETAFGWPSQSVGIVFMIATAPMLFMPALGSHMVTRWGWRSLFATGLAMLIIGDALLFASACSTEHLARLALAVLGMALAGAGAGLAHPQLSGAIIALLPPEQTGMASAITIAFRQGGFALGVAALGAALAHPVSLTGSVSLFLLATAAPAAGLWVTLKLLPRDAGQNRADDRSDG